MAVSTWAQADPGDKQSPSAELEREEFAHEALANAQVESASEMAMSVDEMGQVASEEVAPVDANVAEPYLLARLVAHRTVETSEADIEALNVPAGVVVEL